MHCVSVQRFTYYYKDRAPSVMKGAASAAVCVTTLLKNNALNCPRQSILLNMNIMQVSSKDRSPEA